MMTLPVEEPETFHSFPEHISNYLIRYSPTVLKFITFAEDGE